MQPKIRLALADDHIIIREALVLLISNFQHFEVIAEAGNGKELLDKIEGLALLPEICILDVKMPLLNGFETLLELKRKRPNIKVLMLSMYDNELGILKFLRNGADGYLVKDSAVAELQKALVQIYKGGIYMPSQLLRKAYDCGDRSSTIPVLSHKEYLFLSYCSTELTYKEIADRMHQSLRTIEGYRNQLFYKLRIKSRTGLAIYAIETGIDFLYMKT